MATSNVEEHGRHPTFRQYVLVAIILFVITMVEFLLIYDKVGIDDDLGASKIPLLIILSAIKFAIVIMFYMHLKFDARLFSGIFLAGLALAFAVGIGLLGLFVALQGGPREFAEDNAVPYAHAAEPGAAEEHTSPAIATEPTDPYAGAPAAEDKESETTTAAEDSTVATEPEKPVVAETTGPVNLQVGVEGDQLKFSSAGYTTSAGSEVILTFANVSSFNQHNWVVVVDGTKDAVAAAGIGAGPDNDYVLPGDARVIAHTKLLAAGETGEVRFTAPAAGTYQFVCTFPGHNFTMFGTFEVTS